LPNRRVAILALLPALLLSALLIGPISPADARSHAVTIRFAGNTGSEVVWGALIDNFEQQNPDINVNAEFVPPNTYPQVLLTQLQSGSAPDVFNTSPGFGNINSVGPLVQAGYLADLSKLPFAKRVPQAWRSLYFIKGKLYAAGLALGPITMTLRPDLWQQLGLKVPSTFSQLLALCRDASAKGKIPVALGGQFPGLLGIALAGNYVYSTDPAWNAKRLAGKVTFAGTRGWHTVLDRFLAMKDANCFSPGAAGTGIPQAIAQFASGQGLIYTGPAGPVGAIRSAAQNPKMPLITFPVPGDTKAQTRVESTFDGIAVNARSANLQAAKKFVSFIGREGQSRLFAKVNGGVSAIDAKTGKLPDYMQTYVKPLFVQKHDLPFENLAWPNPVIYQNFAAGLTGLLTGQTTPDQVLKSMDDAWK
jgi:raffinose/stachyose/melibiose transport system substrate-binding protein